LLQVFGPDSKQEKVYNQAIVPIVQEVLEGFNCTIFAYGQTGTGKTYTMEGGPRNSADGKLLSAEAGIVPRSIRQIFDALECNEITDSSVKVSFMEIYNEELTDLLSITDDKDKKLRLLEDRSGVVVQYLEEVVVKNAAGTAAQACKQCAFRRRQRARFCRPDSVAAACSCGDSYPAGRLAHADCMHYPSVASATSRLPSPNSARWRARCTT
jgi:Kinesin motor domain